MKNRRRLRMSKLICLYYCVFYRMRSKLKSKVKSVRRVDKSKLRKYQ